MSNSSTPQPQFEVACADMSYEDCLALVEGDGLVKASKFNTMPSKRKITDCDGIRFMRMKENFWK